MTWTLDAEITVVLFAGLGGACEGLEDAGCPVQVACNHDSVAIAAHTANHPHTRHIKGDIFDVDPIEATGGRRVKVLWASPDCRDHSVAKGGAPRSARVRSLPWQVCRWVGKTRPRIVMLENVREIRGWGPLIARRDKTTGRVLKQDGTVAAKGERVPVWDQVLVRDKRYTGRSFKAFIRHLQKLGAEYEDRDLCCADYGIPTIRSRWFAVARFDGRPICWPERTHAPAKDASELGLKPWVGAYTVIDWSIPTKSIFNRTRPLSVNTEKRIAIGLRKFVLENPRPFIVPVCHSRNLTAHDGAEPLRTITTEKGGGFAVVGTSFMEERRGNSIGQDLRQPLGTQTQAPHHSIVSAWMAQHNGAPDLCGVYGRPAVAPLSTLTTTGSQQGVVTATLAHLRGTGTATDIERPMPTLTAGGNHVACVAAFLTKYYSQGGQDQDIKDPLHSLTTKDRFSVVTASIKGQAYTVSDITMRMLSPSEAAAAHELRLPELIELGGAKRPLTKTEAMRLIGNSVPKRMSALIAKANHVHSLDIAQRTAA